MSTVTCLFRERCRQTDGVNLPCYLCLALEGQSIKTLLADGKTLQKVASTVSLCRTHLRAELTAQLQF